MKNSYYQDILLNISEGRKSLAILIDPDKFDPKQVRNFLNKIPSTTTHFFVGGSVVTNGNTEDAVRSLKTHSELPVFLFPGDHSQITELADALLFLSLLSGRNAEYLVGQHVKSITTLRNSSLEVISTGYLLLDGGNTSAVERVTNTKPLLQTDVDAIVDTAMAGEFIGAKLIYLEAGSGAIQPVSSMIIRAVKETTNVPIIVGGGIRTEAQKFEAYNAGADIVVMGTAFEIQST